MVDIGNNLPDEEKLNRDMTGVIAQKLLVFFKHSFVALVTSFIVSFVTSLDERSIDEAFYSSLDFILIGVVTLPLLVGSLFFDNFSIAMGSFSIFFLVLAIRFRRFWFCYVFSSLSFLLSAILMNALMGI